MIDLKNKCNINLELYYKYFIVGSVVAAEEKNQFSRTSSRTECRCPSPPVMIIQKNSKGPKQNMKNSPSIRHKGKL